MNTVFLIISSSTSGLKYIALSVLVSSIVYMKEKSKLNVEYLKIHSAILQNTVKLLNPDWIYNSLRQFSEYGIVFFTSQNPK